MNWEALLTWSLAEYFELPWRKKRSAYGTLVSEIMLQQTQVDQVIPYYHRFMKRFPSVRKLAEAPRDDVLKHWEP